jgi:hypothetical protein
MSTPPPTIDCFLDRVAAELTQGEQQSLMPGIRNGFDELWACGDEDARAQEACDMLMAIAKAGGEFPMLFAQAARIFEALDESAARTGNARRPNKASR